MDFTLTRTKYRADGIFGDLLSSNGDTFATLEHSFTNGDQYTPAVLPGTYTCTRRMSPRFGFEVFVLENVPGHDFIEIHVGNFNADSEGCILVGKQVVYNGSSEMITNSRESFSRFMSLQEGVNSFQLKIC